MPPTPPTSISPSAPAGFGLPGDTTFGFSPKSGMASSASLPVDPPTINPLHLLPQLQHNQPHLLTSQSWRCAVCSAENDSNLDACQKCSTPLVPTSDSVFKTPDGKQLILMVTCHNLPGDVTQEEAQQIAENEFRPLRVMISELRRFQNGVSTLQPSKDAVSKMDVALAPSPGLVEKLRSAVKKPARDLFGKGQVSWWVPIFPQYETNICPNAMAEGCRDSKCTLKHEPDLWQQFLAHEGSSVSNSNRPRGPNIPAASAAPKPTTPNLPTPKNAPPTIASTSSSASISGSGPHTNQPEAITASSSSPRQQTSSQSSQSPRIPSPPPSNLPSTKEICFACCSAPPSKPGKFCKDCVKRGVPKVECINCLRMCYMDEYPRLNRGGASSSIAVSCNRCVAELVKPSDFIDNDEEDEEQEYHVRIQAIAMQSRTLFSKLEFQKKLEEYGPVAKISYVNDPRGGPGDAIAVLIRFVNSAHANKFYREVAPKSGQAGDLFPQLSVSWLEGDVPAQPTQAPAPPAHAQPPPAPPPPPPPPPPHVRTSSGSTGFGHHHQQQQPNSAIPTSGNVAVPQVAVSIANAHWKKNKDRKYGGLN